MSAPPSLIPLLLRIINPDSDDSVRAAAASELEELMNSTPDTVADLVAVATDPTQPGDLVGFVWLLLKQ